MKTQTERQEQTTLEDERAAYTQALDKALESILDRLARMPEVERVILFGSYASGRRDLFTDLDLLVVMESELGYVERTADLYRRIQAGVDLDLLAYTPEEFARLRESGFVKHALATGQVIYERKRI
jgi:predicted nucleotidyltransferase